MQVNTVNNWGVPLRVIEAKVLRREADEAVTKSHKARAAYIVAIQSGDQEKMRAAYHEANMAHAESVRATNRLLGERTVACD